MDFYYRFFENDTLLIQKFVGEWSTSNYEKYVNFSAKPENVKHLKKILTDLTDVTLKHMKYNELILEIGNLINIRDKISNTEYMNVFRVSAPNLTVVTQLYQSIQVKKGLNYEFCSTLEQASKLLDLNYTESQLESLIHSLNNKF